MGHFLATSGLHNNDLEKIIEKIKIYCVQYGCICELDTSEGFDENINASLYNQNKFTVILWPAYFNFNDFEICKYLSRELSCLISTIHIYDDDYWAHGLFLNGEEKDKFCTFPTYFEEDNEKLRNDWKGNPEIISELFKIDKELIKGYLINQEPKMKTKWFGLKKEYVYPEGKIHKSDEFPIDDFWVFCDFWKKLGIHYPEDIAKFDKKIRLDDQFREKLPSEYEL